MTPGCWLGPTVVLSRVAVSVYLLGRRLERAEHLARLVRVHNELALDRALPRDEGFWPGFLELAGWSLADQMTREQAIELALAGSVGPSVQRAVEEARRAAQAVRPTLSTEVYEQLNVLHWRLQDGGWDGDLYSYLRQAELGVQLVGGLLDDTMVHDEAWQFVRLGKYLERAIGTARFVVRKSAELAQVADDAVEWAAALRCCASFEPYQQRFSAPITGERVVGYLLLDAISPRSVAFCVGEALRCVRQIDAIDAVDAADRRRQPSRPHRALEQLIDFLGDGDAAGVTAAPAEFEKRFQDLRGELEAALRDTYFVPSRLAVALPGDELAAHPQQQQQAML